MNLIDRSSDELNIYLICITTSSDKFSDEDMLFSLSLSLKLTCFNSKQHQLDPVCCNNALHKAVDISAILSKTHLI